MTYVRVIRCDTCGREAQTSQQGERAVGWLRVETDPMVSRDFCMSRCLVAFYTTSPPAPTDPAPLRQAQGKL